MSPARPFSIPRVALALTGMALAAPASAQTQPSVEELLRRIDALQHRVEELESSRRAAPPQTGAATQRGAATPAARGRNVAAAGQQRPTPVAEAVGGGTSPAATPPAALSPRQIVDEGLKSDLPGLAIRIPGTDTSVRLYGFARLNTWGSPGVYDSSDAPAVSGVPLAGSAADRQGSGFNMSARRSRIGIDTRTPTGWGNLDTKIEMDFAGTLPTGSSASTSSSYTPRLRLAYAELGPPELRVLAGQAASLWNDPVVEILSDATNLNQSAVRQATLRVSGRLAPGLIGQVGIEAPSTDYTDGNGTFYPSSTLDGGASPAFNTMPDLLGRLTYGGTWGEVAMRGLVRQLQINTYGTSAVPANQTQSGVGFGFAAQANVAMQSVIPVLGADRFMIMGYYGQGIGRYFDGNSAGLGATSNLGLANATNSFSLNAVETYGVLVGYRHFWSDTLRSNTSYAYAKQDFAPYTRQFAAGSGSAIALNREMQQAVVNMIWSPWGTIKANTFDAGRLDVGIEYNWMRRDLQGGSNASGTAGAGHGIENRILGQATVRF